MRIFLGAFLALALIGEIFLAWSLFQSYSQSTALSSQIKHLQDIVREREFLWMRTMPNVNGEIFRASNGKTKIDPELRELLLHWFQQDLAIYQHILVKDPDASRYSEQLQVAANTWLSATDTVFNQLSQDVPVDAAVLDKEAREYNSAYARLEAALKDEKAGMKNPELVPEDIILRWQEVEQRFESLLVWTLVYNTVLALVLASFCKWGPEDALRDLNNSTSFFQKCLLLVLTPFVFEFVFISVLAIMFFHSNSEMQRVQEWISTDGAVTSLYSKIEALGNQGDLTGSLERDVLQDLASFRNRVKGRQQQSEVLDAVEECVGLISKKLAEMRRLRAAPASQKNNDAIVLLDNQRSLITLRAITYMFYAKPEIGQQKFVKYQHESLRHQIETNRNLQYGLVLGVVFNFFLAYLLCSYFNRATGKRLEVITNNIERMAERKPLFPQLAGADEFARLDSVFHNTSSLLIETIKKERAAIDNATDVICALEGDFSFALLNPASEEIWGISTEELKGKRIDELVYSQDLVSTLAALKEARFSRQAVSFENRIERPNSTPVDMLWSAQWSEPEQQFFCVAQDITERKQIERLKQELVAMVSHDLRTPLTAATMFLELLEVGVYGQISANGEEELQLCLGQVNGLISLIKDLLDIERLESGKLEFEFTAVDVEDIIDISCDTLKPHIKSKNLTLSKDFPESSLVGDEDRLIQSFIALLANAITLAIPGSNLALSATQKDEIVDFSIAFTCDDLTVIIDDAVFEKYKRSTLPDPSSYGGSPLGLALAKAVVERHGGLVSIAETELEISKARQVAFYMKVPVTRRSGTPVSLAFPVKEGVPA